MSIMNSAVTPVLDAMREVKRIRRVILESPYAGDVSGNISYARRCIRDSLIRGEAPLASHLLYTQEGILNDGIPEERNRGINAGHAWLGKADAVVVYQDYGISEGMKLAIERAMLNDVPVEFRRLPEDSDKPLKTSIQSLAEMLTNDGRWSPRIAVVAPTGQVARNLISDLMKTEPRLEVRDRRNVADKISQRKMFICIPSHFHDINRICIEVLQGRSHNSPVVLFEMTGAYADLADDIERIAKSQDRDVFRMNFPNALETAQ